MSEALTHAVPHPVRHLLLPRFGEKYPLDRYLSMELEDIIAELAEQTYIHLVEDGESLFNAIEDLAAMTRLAAGLMVIEFSYKKRAYLALADSTIVGAKMINGCEVLHGEKAVNELESSRGPATIILYLTSLGPTTRDHNTCSLGAVL